MSARTSISLFSSLALVALTAGRAQPPTSSPSEIEWPHYASDHASSKYSAAAQIEADNVGRLEVAWRWETPDEALDVSLPTRSHNVTPLMVGGRLYTISSYNVILALDPASGEELWRFDPKAYERGRPPHGGFNSRGVELWRGTDASGKPIERIFAATATMQLVSLDAATGEPDPGFGDGGIVDLRRQLADEYRERDIGVNAPPLACGDTVIVGSIINDFGLTQTMPPGHVRGYDPRTGERKWIFHTIPQEGEAGTETWEEEAWRVAGNTNVWSMMSCDDERGLAYLPVSTPTDDHYGGHRLGDNLYAESLLVLDAATGEHAWHFQGVHHGIWDYDFPCAPNLVYLEVDGESIEAVAQVSKQGFVYVFDRATGEPVWPIEERRVPASTVPGERAAETQPYPTKPPPFERQGIGEDDLLDFTPELAEAARRIAARYKLGPLFTPPIVADEDGKAGLLQLPGAAGGANWGGAAFDPESGRLFVPSQTRPSVMGLREGGGRGDLDYNRGGGRVENVEGLPIVAPPWSRLTAIDLNEGTIAWQVPHGDGPREHPTLADLDVPRLGTFPLAGLSPGAAIATSALLFTVQTAVNDATGAEVGPHGHLRAYDKTTGDLLFERKLETAPRGAPMTYIHAGKQYVLVAVGGGGQKRELIAFALP